MEVPARLRHAPMSAQKVRLVADRIRGISAFEAVNRLKFMKGKAPAIMLKVVESALANAENNHGADIDELKISTVFVDEAPSLGRFRARAKGRGARIVKRRCHINVFVSSRTES